MANSTTPDAVIVDLLGTARTARCHNGFFCQQQLKFLHDVLRSNVDHLRDAIKQDTKVTDAEATTEVAAVLDIVKEHYTSIDPKQELEDEYRVARGKNALDRSVPWGVVYIEPDLGHTASFSVLSATTAALAAGNCVALKLDNNLQSLPSFSEPSSPDSATIRLINLGVVN
ncbi:hypothetical protein CC80DRAFT_542911 [Byssothecium circinans]|uniref:Aldehyde dehydrogenase domain-containing protein n=1 Tax=Byssothecium circinans TaxID=147558 RepID=A0A6A5UD40_9PLEO|nr:hypothetical protein CC80DRAFT_542911 [Byssothecium circinans]